MSATRLSAEQRRAQLLETAKGLFSEAGYEAVSTRSIAEAAGVSEALLFRFFPTKLELFHAVIRGFGFRDLMPAPPAPLWLLPVDKMLRMVLTGFLEMYWSNRSAFRLLFMGSQRDPVATENLYAYFVRPREGLRMMLAAQESRGTFREGEAGAAAEVISNAVSGFIFRSSLMEPEDWAGSREQFVENLVRLIVRGAAPDPAPETDTI